MTKQSVLLFGAILFFPVLASGAVMNSQNFKIGSDVIGIGGGLGNSANFKVGGTLGEMVVGSGDSATFGADAGFWQASAQKLALTCESSDVYMMDYTLGTPENYSKYLFSTSQECQIVDNTNAPWSLTIDSSAMVSSSNNVPDSNVYLSTDGNVGSGDTVTSPATNLTEPAGPDYSLDTVRTVISGSASASGVYLNRPTVKISNLNGLYNEDLTGTVVITIQ